MVPVPAGNRLIHNKGTGHLGTGSETLYYLALFESALSAEDLALFVSALSAKANDWKLGAQMQLATRMLLPQMQIARGCRKKRLNTTAWITADRNPVLSIKQSDERPAP